MSELYRVQDNDGRGPWRPGYSHKWVSDDRNAPNLLPPIFEELPSFKQVVTLAHTMGFHVGVAVRGWQKFAAWFLPDELERLRRDGFNVVQCDNCRVFAETDNQVLIGAKAPLSNLPALPWQHVLQRHSTDLINANVGKVRG